MPTIKQLIHKKIRKKKKKKTPRKILLTCPQRKGVCMKLVRVKPKKPNSAQRKITDINIKIKTNSKKIITKRIKAQLIGEGAHNVQKYTTVLIRGARVRDLPGINYRIIRNKYDVNGVLERKTSRSKYGTKDFLKHKLY